MSQDIALQHGRSDQLLEDAASAAAAARAREQRDRLKRVVGQVRPLAHVGWRLGGLALLGALGAAAVGYLVSRNQFASPRGVAVVWRVSLIGVLVAAGVYAQTSRIQARMGRWLLAIGLLCCVWLLNGSSAAPAYGAGVVIAGIVPTAFALVMLTHPTGRLRSSFEGRFLAVTGGPMAVAWLVLVLTNAAPPFKAPLLVCTAHCPPNPAYLGFGLGRFTAALFTLIAATAWLVQAWGVAYLIDVRFRRSPTPLRRSTVPVRWTAILYAAQVSAFLAIRIGGTAANLAFDDWVVAMTIAIPGAILAALVLERLFMGQALADIVTELATPPGADPQALMSAALRDPSLRIGYRRAGQGTYVDSSGVVVETDARDARRALAWIGRDRDPVAVVTYDGELADQARFVQAAGAAALLSLEQTRLEVDLKTSLADLAASRTRLVEAAHAERQRIERDLHDGVQQDLVGLRIKLDMALDALRADPTRAERVIVSMGRQMDDALDALRSVARGIYPPLLGQRGVAEALRSAARRSPLPVSVIADGLGRYPEDIEVAVYFSCLEALQNVSKHAGAGASARVRLREQAGVLCFTVSDGGAGFDPAAVEDPHGLLNMRDRLEAVGGTLSVSSRCGRGTTVRGEVPVATPAGLGVRWSPR